MAGVNKVILIGRLGKDTESRTLQDGASVCSFSIATSEQWKDKHTGEKQEKTEWHRVVAFRKLAEICGKYLRKGSQIYLEGKLQTRKYEKDGQDHYTTEIVAFNMVMLDSRGQGQGQSQERGPEGTNPGDSVPGTDDDIPF